MLWARKDQIAALLFIHSLLLQYQEKNLALEVLARTNIHHNSFKWLITLYSFDSFSSKTSQNCYNHEYGFIFSKAQKGKDNRVEQK